MNVLGIDPGKSGGLAVSREINSKPKIIFAIKMPTLQINNKKIIDILTIKNN